MLTLKPIDRTLLALVLEGRSFKHAASLVGMDAAAARARLSRAKKANKMRSTLQLAVAFSKENT